MTTFLSSLHDRGKRNATLVAYRSDWKKLAIWSNHSNGEPFDLARAVGREAAEFRAYLLSLGQSPATVNRALAFLGEYAKWAAACGETRASLPAEVAAVQPVGRQALAPRGLSRPELRRFLKEVDVRASIRDRALIYLMLFTGMRLSEAAGLEVRDLLISERKGTASVRSEVAKGGKMRVVPIPAAARLILSMYLAERRDDGGRLFQGERGPIGRNGISRIIAKYAATAKVSMTPHTLRHCFAYRFLAATNNDLIGLADILGHSNVNTTRLYTKRRLEDLESAVEHLDFA